ncbi:MAG: hypothetical protein HY318_19460 [Armatimonadetes bacterium]|nr:hypothetical protein [Armatimonadota bacterium]
MDVHPPIDALGKDLRVGDWVLVVAVPLSLRGMPEESRRAFSRAVGNTFQIESFDEFGYLELFLWPKISLDFIWIEPFCVRRSRRYRQLSKNFQRKLRVNAAPHPPRYELQFDIRFKDGVDLMEFGTNLISNGSGGGFATWPEQNRIEGSVYAERGDEGAREALEKAKRIALESMEAVSVEVSDILENDGI